jgi:hypothetical protein
MAQCSLPALVESNMHRKQQSTNQQQKQKPYEREKRTNINTSDLLIETRLSSVIPLFLDCRQSGERRDKPACCRGCKSPTGKEVANPSWPRVLQAAS